MNQTIPIKVFTDVHLKRKNMHQWNMKIMKLFILLLIVVNDRSGPETQKHGSVKFITAQRLKRPDWSSHSLPGRFSHAAAARLLVIGCGMKVLLLWLPAGTAEEISDPFLPCWSGTRTHGIPSGVLALGWPKQTQQTVTDMDTLLLKHWCWKHPDWLHQCENPHKCHKCHNSKNLSFSITL